MLDISKRFDMGRLLSTGQLIESLRRESSSLGNVDFELQVRCRFYPTHHDARYPSFVTVHYPLHPLYGHGELQVRQRHGSGGAELYVVDVKPDAQAIPVWMIDEQRCSKMTIGFDPQCSLDSYFALLSLIRSVDL